jgi:aurora kinase
MIHNQLLREIKIQISMSHPNIIDLYGVFADSENIYLLQELGLNGHLYDLMKKKNKFSEETTALISRDVLKGLQGLHGKNIIHRDIKP